MFKSLLVGLVVGFVVWSLFGLADEYARHFVQQGTLYLVVKGAVSVASGLVMFLYMFFMTSPTPRKSAPRRRR